MIVAGENQTTGITRQVANDGWPQPLLSGIKKRLPDGRRFQLGQ
jgi:hypothetical protein